MIGLEQKGQGSEALDAGKTADSERAPRHPGSGEAGKQDFNAAGPGAISDVLIRKDPLSLGTAAADRYASSHGNSSHFRDKDRPRHFNQP